MIMIIPPNLQGMAYRCILFYLLKYLILNAGVDQQCTSPPGPYSMGLRFSFFL